MSLIKCFLNIEEEPEIDGLKLLLPIVPTIGESNFDIQHKGEFYNCEVWSVDWVIKEGKFSHCNIFLHLA